MVTYEVLRPQIEQLADQRFEQLVQQKQPQLDSGVSAGSATREASSLRKHEDAILQLQSALENLEKRNIERHQVAMDAVKDLRSEVEGKQGELRTEVEALRLYNIAAVKDVRSEVERKQRELRSVVEALQQLCGKNRIEVHKKISYIDTYLFKTTASAIGRLEQRMDNSMTAISSCEMQIVEQREMMTNKSADKSMPSNSSNDGAKKKKR